MSVYVTGWSGVSCTVCIFVGRGVMYCLYMSEMVCHPVSIYVTGRVSWPVSVFLMDWVSCPVLICDGYDDRSCLYM